MSTTQRRETPYVVGAREELAKWSTSTRGAIYDMQLIAEAADLLTTGFYDVIAQAREQGATWEEIGAALGTSKQQAHRKYAHLFGPSTP